MTTQYRAGEIRRSLQRFSDFANDLLASDYNTFEDRLNLLISFCESDAVFANIHKQLMNFEAIDFDAWIKERFATMGGMSGSGELLFPTNLEARMSVMYQLLVAVRDKRIDWMQFGITFFATDSTRYDEYIYTFNEAITRPLVRELSYRLRDMEESLPTDKTAPVAASAIQIIHHATNVIQQTASGTGIIQRASLGIDPRVAELLFELRSTVAAGASNADDEARDSGLIDLAEEELSLPKPRKSKLAVLFKALPAAEKILSITSSILEIVNKTSGGGP
jgi:hypothetical protein